MITVIDLETTQTLDKRGNMNPSPYLPENRIVCVGWKMQQAEARCVWFYHEDRKPTPNGFEEVQCVLDQTKLLVAHNMKFDLAWLLEAGFKYEGALYDTMCVEYLLNRARKRSLQLKSLAEKYLPKERKAVDLIAEYVAEGVTFDQIPWGIVEEYNLQDVNVTRLIREAQLERLEG